MARPKRAWTLKLDPMLDSQSVNDAKHQMYCESTAPRGGGISIGENLLSALLMLLYGIVMGVIRREIG
jgi:hypothetical protein